MKTAKLKDMRRGWFIGNFEPSLYRTGDFEAAVKTYAAGEKEEAHCHKIATEYTVVVSGTVRMNGTDYHAGDIIVEEPGDTTNFFAVTDAVNVVIKTPCVLGDKYVVERKGN